MSERNESPSVGTGTAEIPVVRAHTPAPGPQTVQPPPSTQEPLGAQPPEESTGPAPDLVPGMQPTAPVTVRPAPRMPRVPRRGPLTVMGPWAPVAGGLLGLLLGVVVVLVLAGSAESFEDRLALAFTTVGLGMLGTAGILLADEVRAMRQRARDALTRPEWLEATADLLNGLTPARLLLLMSGFVLFLAAYVSR